MTSVQVSTFLLFLIEYFVVNLHDVFCIKLLLLAQLRVITA